MSNLYALFGKRALDVVLAFALGLLSAPAAFVAALAVRLDDGYPPLFRQQRVGRAGQEFTIYKLRSMCMGTATLTSAEAMTLQITRVGRFLRRTNADEIPQLWNVIRGEMSLVGPRPALPSQTRLLELRAASGAVDVRPGLTGLAQINAYDGMSEDEKATWDARYAASLSFLRDLSILLRTFRYLLKSPPRY